MENPEVQVKIQYGSLKITPLGIEYLSEKFNHEKSIGNLANNKRFDTVCLSQSVQLWYFYTHF